MCSSFHHKIAHTSRTVKDIEKRLKFLRFPKGLYFEASTYRLNKIKWEYACAIASNIKLPIYLEPLKISKNGLNFWASKRVVL